MSDTLNATLSRALLACAILLGAASPGADAVAQGVAPGAPQPAANPMCVRLEGQLATIERGGGGDPARADQLRRYEDAASKQQGELDRVTAQAKRQGCDSSGFFSMFNGQSAQCGPINNQIQQMRGNLDQITGNLERLRVGTPGSSDRDSQRRSVMLALAQNNCGPQYAAAARNPGPGGNGAGNFLNNLFGNNEPSPEMPADGAPAVAAAPSGTYRTVCVRTCDGAYFPISFATVQSRFADDERTCKSLCPASDANLFSYRNPGEDMNAAVSISGQPYTSSPNAFRYRTEFNPSCACKAQGQTWSEALKNIDDKAAAGSGDIIVTEERAKQMSLPPAKGTPAAAKKAATPAPPAAGTPTESPAAAAPADPNKPIRSVGPTFLPKAQ